MKATGFTKNPNSLGSKPSTDVNLNQFYKGQCFKIPSHNRREIFTIVPLSVNSDVSAAMCLENYSIQVQIEITIKNVKQKVEQ